MSSNSQQIQLRKSPHQSHSSTSKSRSKQSATPSVRLVPNERKEGGCVVVAMAAVSGASYDRAREAAVKQGFVKDEGIYLSDAVHALPELGVEGEYHAYQPNTWNQFPNKAIVEVKAPDGENHAVALHGDYIYDGNESAPIHRDNYSIFSGGSYIKLPTRSVKSSLYPPSQKIKPDKRRFFNNWLWMRTK